MTRYAFPHGTTVDVNPLHVVTTFKDGKTIVGTPQHDPESEARARALGFTDVWAMTATHDPLHSLVAEYLGWPHSYALRAAALGRKLPVILRERADIEERMVLALQRACNHGFAILSDYAEPIAPPAVG